MQQTFAIIWAAKYRDGVGVGTKRFSKEEAEALAADLNEAHPAFLHAVVDTATENPAEKLLLLKRGALEPVAEMDASDEGLRTPMETASRDASTVVLDGAVFSQELALAG